MQCKVSNMQQFKYVVFFPVLCLKSGAYRYNFCNEILFTHTDIFTEHP